MSSYPVGTGPINRVCACRQARSHCSLLIAPSWRSLQARAVSFWYRSNFFGGLAIFSSPVTLSVATQCKKVHRGAKPHRTADRVDFCDRFCRHFLLADRPKRPHIAAYGCRRRAHSGPARGLGGLETKQLIANAERTDSMLRSLKDLESYKVRATD